MNILIVAATELEYRSIKDHLSLQKLISFHKIDFLPTGVGMVHTSYSLTKYLHSSKPDLILNIGLAGTFNLNIKIGEVVDVIEERFADLGAENDEEFLSLEELNLQDENEFPFSNGKILNQHNFNLNIPKVNGITVNKVHGNDTSIKKIIQKSNPQIETMEGAAVFYVAMMEKIPCLQIRSISNVVEKRNKANWNIPLALESLSKKVIEFLENLR